MHNQNEQGNALGPWMLHLPVILLPCVRLGRNLFDLSFLVSGASLLPKFAREPRTQHTALDMSRHVCWFHKTFAA